MTRKMISVGERVQYKAAFCRSIGAYTGAIPFARGEVVQIKSLSQETRLAGMKWDGDYSGELPKWVNVANLVQVGQDLP